ncbi:DNA-3-methyladenine glycosylase 2 family protein [Jongsikchunia kroppenstedtii]|uniref:AlkA N-terminal domain-containing protein n=1 Tax=Jongsikchunia kroppenstedtii TaxID=1121721 RepID=UPI000372FF9F
MDFDSCYRALQAHDRRFDGQFFAAVHTTGIYCRPSCPVVPPKPQNVSFVLTAATAITAGYRACRRCLPDAVPGSPRWNTRADTASRAMRLIQDGLVDRGGVTELAGVLGYSPRQLNRIMTDELGAGPLALAKGNRTTTARLLLQTTELSVADVAFAAGFGSVRQFNDSIRDTFACTPTELRSRARNRPTTDELTLNLPVRQPFSASWLRRFLSGHAIAGLEEVDDAGRYRRTMRLPHGPAIIEIGLSDDTVAATLRLHDLRDLGAAVSRIRRLLDLDADLAAAEDALRADRRLRPLVARGSGIRLPGSHDPWELLLRTMIGQQISLAAARTHGARLVAALGDQIADDRGKLHHLFPTPAQVAEHGADVSSGPRRRIDAICRVASEFDGLAIHSGRDYHELVADLQELPGVGRWTAEYVAMRSVGHPDTLLDTDLVVRRSAERLGLDLRDSGRWAPWRSYLTMLLWHDELRRTEPLLAA